MIRTGLLVISLLALATGPAFADKPQAQCKAVLGKDFNVGLKERAFEILETSNWFSGPRPHLASDVFEVLYGLELSADEIASVIDRIEYPDTRDQWRLKLAGVTGDWSVVYEPDLINRRTDLIMIGGYREAVSQAAAGERITALDTFRERRDAAILVADNDTTRTILQDPNFESFLSIGILRALVMQQRDAEAREFVDNAGIDALDAYLTAMIDGRNGEKAILAELSADQYRGRIDRPTLLGRPVSHLGEFVFQAIAANRRDLAKGLHALAGTAAMGEALMFKAMLIDDRRDAALTFAYTMQHPQVRGLSFDDAILDQLAERGDVEALQAILPLAEPDGYTDHAVRNAMVYALARNGDAAAALEAAGEKSLGELGTNWIMAENGLEPGAPAEGPGQGILPAIVAFGEMDELNIWRQRLNDRQGEAMDLLLETARFGFDAAEDYMATHPNHSHLGNDPWRQINNFDLTLSLFAPTTESTEIWYDYILSDPARHNLAMSEWLWLLKEHCLDWAYIPSGRTEGGVLDYRYRGTSFGGGVGGMILLSNS